MSTTSARSIGTAQLAVGLVTALLPRRVASFAAGGGRVPPAAIVRVLGIRQAVQGAALIARPTRDTLAAGAAVDAIHAASLVPLVALSPRYRAVAAASAALALTAAAAELSARSAVRSTSIPTSRIDQLIAAGLVRPARGNLADLPAPEPGPNISAELRRMRDEERY